MKQQDLPFTMRGRKVLRAVVVLCLLGAGFVLLRPASDGLDWIRKYKGAELVSTHGFVDGEYSIHDFHFGKIPQGLLDEFPTHSATSGTLDNGDSYWLRHDIGEIQVIHRPGSTWFARQWLAVKLFLGLQPRMKFQNRSA